MSTNGIDGLMIETHNWGRTVAFWTGLGFELVFETDHHSGELRHPAGGPYVFIAERPEDHPLEVQPMLSVDDSTAFAVPGAARVDRPFEAQHWNVMEMLLCDPDDRRVSVQAPLPAGTEAPVGHG